jgi:ComB9 competence protein
MKIKTLIATTCFLLAATSPVVAQTVKMPPTPINTPTTAVPRPVADSVVAQAEDHAEGLFPVMSRAAVGGQIQEAWDDTDNETGVFSYALCETCTYKVRVREHMVTVLELPEGEIIDRADVGDGGTFDVKPRGPRRLAIKPRGFGIDTSLLVYGMSGNIYPFYLRAESFNSVNVPDLIVRITGQVTIEDMEVAGIHLIKGRLDPLSGLPAMMEDPTTDSKSEAVAGLETPDPDRKANDFVQEAKFDPNALRGWGEYKLWAGGPDGKTMEPETVFRDDHFTYIRFGARWKNLELPTAYVVVDDIDELVNTRIQGQTFIVESTRNLITLKSGLSYLCIKFEGDV